MTQRLAIPLAVAGALVVFGESPRGRQPRFRSGVEAVQVDVQVMQGGKPVEGLTTADFELKDSGVLQEVRAISFQDVPISLLLALDVSASVEGEALGHLKDAARAAVRALRPGDQAALIGFAERLKRLSDWTSDLGSLEGAIDRLEATGATSLHDVVFTGLALRERAAGRTVMLVFTDGADTASWLDARTVIEAAQRSDLVVTAVSTAPPAATSSAREALESKGVAASFRRWLDDEPRLFPYAFLERLTEDTGGELIYLTSNRDLSRAFGGIVAAFKTRYLLTYEPKDVPAEGWHPIEVKLKRRSGQVTARRGYWR